MFGRSFRVFVGSVSLLSGLIMLLWASDQGALWKYLPALFCFCIFGIVALPRPLAIACGYVVAGCVLGLCAVSVYSAYSGRETWWRALRVCEVYGLPALAFVVYRQIPGRSRGDA